MTSTFLKCIFVININAVEVVSTSESYLCSHIGINRLGFLLTWTDSWCLWRDYSHTFSSIYLEKNLELGASLITFSTKKNSPFFTFFAIIYFFTSALLLF